MVGLSQVRALHVLSAARLGRPRAIEVASSVTNEVWMTDRHVVRINRKATGRLRREAELAPHLPPACGYPGIVAAGAGGGMDWMVLNRMPGVPLAHVWPDLPREQRRSAVHQLAELLRAVHATPTPPGLAPLLGPQLLVADELNPLRPVEDALATAHGIASIPRSILDALTDRFYDLAPAIGTFGGSHLVHGDLTFENVIWEGGRITALIDFEWSRGSPASLDLDVLLRMCAYPWLHVADRYGERSTAAEYAEVPMWFARSYPELFRHPRLLDLLELYSLAFDLHELVRFPPRSIDDELPPIHARNRIEATIDGRGHLARWFARVS
jgi:aminoglycoside phosphotransferase (APT) family kinase protein